MDQEQTPHKRRVRYKGKYPRKFEEKYKELQPEKYGDTIAHVIQKGNTPAGMHISIMVKEILDFLKIQPGETGFDATLGYGGHTKAMLEQLQGCGHIYATDVDPEESAKTKKRLAEAGYGEEILTIRLQNFCTIDEIAKEVGGFDFILADLGVSSMQIDNPSRGFSFKVDGPLDLRLNQQQGISAAERLDTISREELAGMLYENSDEPYCEELAKAITDEIRKGHRIDTTTKLREVIEKTLDFLPEKEKKDTIKKTCQRTFQALRIDVNREFEVLYEFMEKLPGALKPGGRVAILTFHSGEDKLVKQALKEGYRNGIYADYAKDVIRPSAEECVQNGRARSTKMRWAVRAEEQTDRRNKGGVRMTVMEFINAHREDMDPCECVILPDGSVEEPQPSHIKKLEEISGEDKLTLNSRMEKNMEPIFFMVEYTGCMLIWSTRVVVPSHPTPAQEETLETLYFAAMLAPGYHREQVGETYEECVRKAKELH